MMDLSCKWNFQQVFTLAPNHKSIGLRRRLAWRAQTINSELQTSSPISGPNPPAIPQTPIHSVTVHDRQRGVTHRFLVPEDQYILHTAEAQDITLPFACRHGCCTSCAVRVKSGQIRQPEALGISAELKDKMHRLAEWEKLLPCDLEVQSWKPPLALQVMVAYYRGYALLCVGFPSSDVEVETQDEDEVYWLQFGRYFARGPVERDDYALELAIADE